VAEIAGEYGIHPQQIAQWKKQVLEGIPDLLSDTRRKSKGSEEDLVPSSSSAAHTLSHFANDGLSSHFFHRAEVRGVDGVEMPEDPDGLHFAPPTLHHFPASRLPSFLAAKPPASSPSPLAF